MIRPQKMKYVRLAVLENDVDTVLEFLGHSAVMQFSDDEKPEDSKPIAQSIHFSSTEILDTIHNSAAWLGITLPEEPEESSQMPGQPEEEQAQAFISMARSLHDRESALIADKQKLDSMSNEARAFASLNAPFSNLDHLSYLTLRIGRLDPSYYNEMEDALAGRAVILHLGEGDRVLAAASRKGRFALDTELKKREFVPLTIPENYQGIPAEVFASIDAKIVDLTQALAVVTTEKAQLRSKWMTEVRSLVASYLLAASVQTLKERLVTTKNVYLLSGWVPADSLRVLIVKIETLTGNRVAIRVFEPDEVPSIRDGQEKVPVSIKHGAFVRGFEPLIFSYGAPLYGTIDPTPFVAFFFTLLFGIMFGDVGQGLVLVLLGFLTGKKGTTALKGFRHFSAPLKVVGCSSMIMGLFYGSVFSNEELLAAPTRAFTGFLTGHPVDHILHLMPDAENMAKIFYFFGFTIAIGVILNSIGLIINIINQVTLKHYEHAFFSKTGLSGAIFFWYAIFIAVRIIFGGHIVEGDVIGIALPILLIFFGPVLWRIISGTRPFFKEGLLGFVIEGLVEIIETVSSYISNTVSFLRVGAFALSHVILSFIIFTMADKVSTIALGPVWSAIIIVFGNLVIILLEGMIVAIQVVRLQYYEFFGKFFTETGVRFSPFRFRKE